MRKLNHSKLFLGAKRPGSFFFKNKGKCTRRGSTKRKSISPFFEGYLFGFIGMSILYLISLFHQ